MLLTHCCVSKLEGHWAARKLARALAGAIFAIAPPHAHAVDAVIEINQTCAAAGCFGGGAPGFPVTITEAGSYRLTSNLDVSSPPDPANTSAIQIRVSGTTIDLNGFTIPGITACTSAVCKSTGSGHGVDGGIQGSHRAVCQTDLTCP
jgi:hypothetical protein